MKNPLESGGPKFSLQLTERATPHGLERWQIPDPEAPKLILAIKSLLRCLQMPHTTTYAIDHEPTIPPEECLAHLTHVSFSTFREIIHLTATTDITPAWQALLDRHDQQVDITRHPNDASYPVLTLFGVSAQRARIKEPVLTTIISSYETSAKLVVDPVQLIETATHYTARVCCLKVLACAPDDISQLKAFAPLTTEQGRLCAVFRRRPHLLSQLLRMPDDKFEAQASHI